MQKKGADMESIGPARNASPYTTLQQKSATPNTAMTTLIQREPHQRIEE